MSERSRILLETSEARREAESLLRGLIDARTQSEARLAELQRTDILKQVTGRSAMDNAIQSTQHMVDALERVLGDLKRSLSPEELRLLEDEGI